jgi:hypothetical protein
MGIASPFCQQPEILWNCSHPKAVWNAAGTPESSHVKIQSSSLTKVRDIKVELIFDLNY